MKRYLNSFFITLALYLIIAFALFVMFADEKIKAKKSESSKIISLNHIKLEKEVTKKKPVEKKQEDVKPKEVEAKKVEPKKVEKKKIIKKVEPKKPKPKPKPKKIVKKKIVKKKVEKIVKAKKIKEIKKQEVAKTKNQKIEKVVEKKASSESKVTNTAKKTVSTPKEVDVREDYLNQHLAQIRSYITKNVKYPKRARIMHIQDVVRVKFTLLKNGEVTNITILSGSKHLQKATIQAVENASSFFPRVSKDIVIIIPIEYKLI